MSQKHEKPKRKVELPKFLTASTDTVLIIRLVIATVIFATSLIMSTPGFVGVVILVLAAAIAGYDIPFKALSSIENGDYLSLPVVLLVSSVISFFIGFSIEAAAIILLYQIGNMLIRYTCDHTNQMAFELIGSQDDETVAKLKSCVEGKQSPGLSIEKIMLSSVGSVLKIAVFLALVYAIALPIFTNFSYLVSVHRALMIILVATPMSVIVSIPIAGNVGLCYSAGQGVVFNSSKDLETMAEVEAAIFDKAGIFADECPRIVAIYSDVLDSSTFMNFAAHALYYSEQPIAKAVSAVYEQKYMLDIIKDFREIPGCGVELSINGINAVFATKEYLLSRGVALPENDDTIGQSYYMLVAGKPIGRIVISSDLNEETENLVPEMKASGVGRCILLTEDNKEAGQQLAELMNFNEMYPQCSGKKKLSMIKELSDKIKGKVAFIYSNGIDSHTAADLDIRVSNNTLYADALVAPECIENIPFSKQVAMRVREVAIENALFAFVVKSLLIFLSIIGYCNLWFAIFIDYVAAIATILNTIRVTNESIITKLRYKTQK